MGDAFPDFEMDCKDDARRFARGTSWLASTRRSRCRLPMIMKMKAGADPAQRNGGGHTALDLVEPRFRAELPSLAEGYASGLQYSKSASKGSSVHWGANVVEGR